MSLGSSLTFPADLIVGGTSNQENDDFRPVIIGISSFGGFLSHGGTASHHPYFIDGFSDMIFPELNHPASLGYPQD